MATKKKSTPAKVQYSDDKFKRLREIFVPNGADDVWTVTQDACRCCDERFIQISGKAEAGNVLSAALQRVVDDQMLPDFVGHEEVKLNLVVVGKPMP